MTASQQKKPILSKKGGGGFCDLIYRNFKDTYNNEFMSRLKYNEAHTGYLIS